VTCYLLAVSFAALVVAAAALAWAEHLVELEREMTGVGPATTPDDRRATGVQEEATAIAERAWA